MRCGSSAGSSGDAGDGVLRGRVRGQSARVLLQEGHVRVVRGQCAPGAFPVARPSRALVP